MDLFGLPLRVQQAVLIIALPLAVELGYWLNRGVNRLRARRRPDLPPYDPSLNRWEWGSVTAGSTSILGLLLAFIVSMAVDHYEHRRELIVDEANALTTTYVRAQLFKEPGRSRISSEIMNYASDRVALVSIRIDQARKEELRASLARDMQRLSTVAVEQLQQPREAAWATPFLNPMNQMFDLAVASHASQEAGIPRRVISILFIYALTTAMVAGYSAGANNGRARRASQLVFAMIAIVIGLILDLEYSLQGGIKVPPAPLVEAVNSIAQTEIIKSQAVIRAH